VIPHPVAALLFEAAPSLWLGLSADDWIKAIAVVVGAAWTIMNFVRGRTYRKSLDVDLPGTFSVISGVVLFTGQCKATNVGSSKISIHSYGTGVYIYTLWLRQYTDGWGVAEELIDTVSLVDSNAWIEPRESFRKPYIRPVPPSRGVFVGVRCEALINNGETVWTVSQICNYPDPKPAPKLSEKE
jgi:hypothetical protein